MRCFFSGGWLRRPGGQGDSDLPLCPLDPLYPLQTAEDTPDPLVPKRALPLFLDRQGPHRAPFGLAWGQQPIGCRNGHALCMAPMPGRIPLQRWSCRGNGPCHHSRDRPAPRTPGRDQLPKATVALPGTDVNPAGRAPARLAVHCNLATGVRGGHAACTLWPPPAPFGYFPARGKYTRPPAGGRNLPITDSHGMQYLPRVLPQKPMAMPSSTAIRFLFSGQLQLTVPFRPSMVTTAPDFKMRVAPEAPIITGISRLSPAMAPSRRDHYPPGSTRPPCAAAAAAW